MQHVNKRHGRPLWSFPHWLLIAGERNPPMLCIFAINPNNNLPVYMCKEKLHIFPNISDVDSIRQTICVGNEVWINTHEVIHACQRKTFLFQDIWSRRPSPEAPNQQTKPAADRCALFDDLTLVQFFIRHRNSVWKALSLNPSAWTACYHVLIGSKT